MVDYYYTLAQRILHLTIPKCLHGNPRAVELSANHCTKLSGASDPSGTLYNSRQAIFVLELSGALILTSYLSVK